MKRKISYNLIFVLALLITLGIACFPLPSEAEYPERPIEMIVPYAPGGAADLGPRVVADKMEKFLGKPIVSVYKPGGAGSLGAAYVAGVKPDGYKFLVGSDTALVIYPALKKLTYTLDDFSFVGGFMKAPSNFTVKGDAPWKTLQDFIADAKKNPKKYKIGVPGLLVTAHVAWELLASRTGFETVAIPFESSGKVMQALLGGHIDVAVTSGVAGMAGAGTIRMLAIAEKNRLSYIPDVPTTYELGYPIELYPIYSFCLPKGTPDAIIKTLSDANAKMFEKYKDELEKSLAKVELAPYFSSGEEYLRVMRERQKIYVELGNKLGLITK